MDKLKKKPMNPGKRFEQNFKASVPEKVFYYRFKDGTSNWATSDKSDTRFQATNICDCELFDGSHLFFIELKSHKGASIPFSAIRPNQIKEMREAGRYNNVIPLIIVDFSDLGECYGMHILDVKRYMEESSRKSIPVEEFQKNGFRIPSEQKKTNTVYDLGILFCEM